MSQHHRSHYYSRASAARGRHSSLLPKPVPIGYETSAFIVKTGFLVDSGETSHMTFDR